MATAPKNRKDIPYFDGVNALVASNLAKVTEFFHAENARGGTIGIIEKREGSTLIGTAVGGGTFTCTANYGLVFFENEGTNNSGLYRFSSSGTPAKITFYYLDSSSDAWTPLTGDGAGISLGSFDHAMAESCLFLVNYVDDNRYITSDGTTVKTSADADGHLFNSPKASKICVYKDRLYLADYYYGTTRYKNTILRSSYPLGIVALISGDPTAADPTSDPWTIDITDSRYLYTDEGANSLDVYRGNTKIAVLTVTSIADSSITATVAFEAGQTQLLSSDEMWITGTYTGGKVFRWITNPTLSGVNVKQYDTMKLTGGDDSEIKMLESIGNVLLAANNNSLSSWNDYTLENFDLNVGCVSKKGSVKFQGSLFFLHYTGVWVTTGGMPKLLSAKIEPYIFGATKTGKEASVAGAKGRSVFFTLGTVTLYNPDGSVEKTLSNVVIEYNITQENWYIHENVKATDFATFVEASDSDRLMMTTTNDDMPVREFLSGDTDDGEEVHFRVDTNAITLSAFEKICYPQDIIVESERGSSVRAFVSLDRGPWYEVSGQVVKGCSILKINGRDDDKGTIARGRTLRVSLRDSSKQRCRILRMSVRFIEAPDEEQQRENDEV
jgi:hypothetical protein